MRVKRPLYEILESRFTNKFCHVEGDGDDGAGGGDDGGGGGDNDSGGGRGGSLLNNGGGNDGDAGGDGDKGGQQGDAKWYWSEGVAGEGEVPEWFKADKYKYADDQAKAYNEVSQKLMQRDELRGAPENYELTISDEVKALIPEGEQEEWGTAPDWFLETAKEFDMTNDQVNTLINKFNLNELNSLPDPKEEAAKLGSTATERINRVANFISQATKGDDALGNLALKFTTTADGIRLFEQMMKTNGGGMMNINDGGDDNSEGVLTKAELKELMFAEDDKGRRKMHVDPDYARMVNAKYKQFYNGTNNGRRKVVDIVAPGG